MLMLGDVERAIAARDPRLGELIVRYLAQGDPDEGRDELSPTADEDDGDGDGGRGEGALPRAAVAGVVDHLAREFPDGVVRVQRQGFEIHPTTWREADGAWSRGPTSRFALLDAVSEVGRPSAALTRQWAEARRGLLELIEAGRIVD